MEGRGGVEGRRVEWREGGGGVAWRGGGGGEGVVPLAAAVEADVVALGRRSG